MEDTFELQFAFITNGKVLAKSCTMLTKHEDEIYNILNDEMLYFYEFLDSAKELLLVSGDTSEIVKNAISIIDDIEIVINEEDYDENSDVCVHASFGIILPMYDEEDKQLEHTWSIVFKKMLEYVEDHIVHNVLHLSQRVLH